MSSHLAGSLALLMSGALLAGIASGCSAKLDDEELAFCVGYIRGLGPLIASDRLPPAVVEAVNKKGAEKDVPSFEPSKAAFAGMTQKLAADLGPMKYDRLIQEGMEKAMEVVTTDDADNTADAIIKCNESFYAEGE